MALGRYTETARSASGDLIRAGQIRVYNAGTGTLATLYRDDAGTIAADNPVTSDLASGAWSAVATSGRYDLAYPDGTTVPDVPFIAPADGTALAAGDISADAPATWDEDTATIGLTPAAAVDPESGTFAADLITALQTAGLMAESA